MPLLFITADRGMQYCSNEYVKLLQQHHALISMTQNGDPYENAMAERVNGILKTELIAEKYGDEKAETYKLKSAKTLL